MILRLASVTGSLALFACSQTRSANDGEELSAGVDTLATDASTGGGEPEVRLDIGDGAEGAGDDVAQGCKKIDFLFAIDNSGSMNAHQVKLQEAFPQFIETIQSEVSAQDYHIMVVDSDAVGNLHECEASCGFCDVGAYSPAHGQDYPCGILEELPECSVTLGGGVNAPYGMNASNQDCGFETGARYMTQDQSNLSEAFICAASVGDRGSSGELTFSAMTNAISPEFTGAGGCNEGFRRDDAILVVTLITDDVPEYGTGDNTGDAGSPQEWAQAIAASVANNEDAVVVLGLIPTGEDSSCIPQYGNSPGTPRFVEFMDLFGEQGITANICVEEFRPFFAEAVGLIDSTCDSFVPVE